MNVNKRDAEQALVAVTGGAEPREGDLLVRARDGWIFSNANMFLGAFDGDPETPVEGKFWFDSSRARMKILIDGVYYESSPWTTFTPNGDE